MKNLQKMRRAGTRNIFIFLPSLMNSFTRLHGNPYMNQWRGSECQGKNKGENDGNNLTRKLELLPTLDCVKYAPQLRCGADISISSLPQVTAASPHQVKMNLTFMRHRNAATSIWMCSAATQRNCGVIWTLMYIKDAFILHRNCVALAHCTCTWNCTPIFFFWIVNDIKGSSSSWDTKYF